MFKRATESAKVVPESVLSNRGDLLCMHNQKGLSPVGGGLSPYTVDLGALDTFRSERSYLHPNLRDPPYIFLATPLAPHTTRCRAATEGWEENEMKRRGGTEEG